MIKTQISSFELPPILKGDQNENKLQSINQFGDWGQHRPQALRAVSALSSMMVQYSKLVYGCQFSGEKGFVNPFLVVEI